MSTTRSKPQGPRGSRPPPSHSTSHSGTSSPSSTNPLAETRISIPSPLLKTAYHAPSILQAHFEGSQPGSLYPSIPPPLNASTPQSSSRSVTPTPRKIALPPLVTGPGGAVGAIGRADPTDADYDAPGGSSSSGPPSLPLFTSCGDLSLNFGGDSVSANPDQGSQSIRPPSIGGSRSRPKPLLGLAIVGGSAAVGGIGANDPDAFDETGPADDVDGGGVTIRPHNPQPAGVEASLDDLNKVLTPRSANSQSSAVPTSPPSADADEGDWTEAEIRLEDVERLGEGAGGEVFKVRDKWTNKILARKIIQARSTPPKQLVRELNALSTTKNENIIRFYGAYLSPSSSEVKVIMELCEGGSLEAVSERIKRLGNRASEKVVGKISEGVCLFPILPTVLLLFCTRFSMALHTSTPNALSIATSSPPIYCSLAPVPSSSVTLASQES
jgi:mitogen-activated protein kinase kinase